MEAKSNGKKRERKKRDRAMIDWSSNVLLPN
jgi:hypothetical protein